MGEIRTTEERTGENVIRDEDRTTNSTNYRKQPSSAIKNHVKRSPLKKTLHILKILLIAIIAGGIIGGVLSMIQTGISLFSINGTSMEPTLKNGSTVVLKHRKNVENGQIIFFHKPNGWNKENNEKKVLVKRIIAKPNDTLSFNGKEFKTNGKNVYTLPPEYNCSLAPQNYEYKLNSSQIFVMGDNALHSMDSRKAFCSGKMDKIFVPKQSVVVYGEIVAQL